MDKLTYAGELSNLKQIQNNSRYEFVKGDICDKELVNQLFSKYNFNGVIHFAAESHVDNSIKNPDAFINTNVYGTFNLLNTAKNHWMYDPFLFKKGCENNRFHHISTDEVYGDVLNGRAKETDSYNPSSPYAASKASSDHLVRSYIRTYNIPAIITNCSNNYGPNQHPEKLIPKLIYNILNNRKLPIYGKGNNSREWIYVSDHCEALIKIFKKGKLSNFYNIGSNTNLNNLSIAKKLLLIAKNKIKMGKNVKIEFVKDRPGHDLRYAINSNKLRKEIKWKPKININRGLEKTLNWYLDNQKYLSSLKKRDITRRLGNKK